MFHSSSLHSAADAYGIVKIYTSVDFIIKEKDADCKHIFLLIRRPSCDMLLS